MRRRCDRTCRMRVPFLPGRFPSRSPTTELRTEPPSSLRLPYQHPEPLRRFRRRIRLRGWVMSETRQDLSHEVRERAVCPVREVRGSTRRRGRPPGHRGEGRIHGQTARQRMLLTERDGGRGQRPANDNVCRIWGAKCASDSPSTGSGGGRLHSPLWLSLTSDRSDGAVHPHPCFRRGRCCRSPLSQFLKHAQPLAANAIRAR